ncbi:MAG: ribonuclease R [Candidatus Aquicultorales bacterium]
MQLTKQIVKAMRRREYKPSTAEELAAQLDGKGFGVGEIKEALMLLEDEGRVLKTSQNRYVVPAEAGMVVGKFDANRGGFGFVEGPSGDLYVPRSKVNGAMYGDTVAARLLRQRRGLSNEAEVVKILDRAHETVIGRVQRRGKVAVVIPADRRIFYDLLVTGGKDGELAEGDMVVAKLTAYPDGKVGAQGEIVEILGGEDSPTIEIDVIIKEHGLADEFSREALAEAALTPETVTEDALAGRKDFRDVFTVTIDGLDAKDFDDAVTFGRSGDDLKLGVHIADVSYYVRPGSALDEEAYNRSTSVYLADRVLPMLPERLSNGICSLNPHVDRLTMSVEMIIDRQGNVKHYDVSQGVIRSDHRLTYEGVDEMFKTGLYPDKQLEELLIGLRDLSDILERKRLDRGALDFETIEPKILLDENLYPVDVLIREKTPATKLIEEAMIVTNETVASFMYWQEAPMVYRAHDKPSLESLTQIEEFVTSFGYPVKKIKEGSSRALQKIIEYAHNRPEKQIVNHLLLRSMKRAVYHSGSSAHFGLASDQYTHFTSPIRRYPDLIVHRLIKAVLAGDLYDPQVVELSGSLEDKCEHTSWMEREAEAAERESIDVKLCQLVSGRVGEVFKGTVSGVTGFGVFVELDNTAEGLVHVRDLPGYFEFNERRFELSNRKTGQIFRIGQTVKVQLTNVLIGERRIDFVLAD